MKKIIYLLFAVMLLSQSVTCPVYAGMVQVDPAFSLDIPEGWELATSNFKASVDPEVAAAFDGADLNEPILRVLGWKLGDNKEFVAAFCVSYAPKGVGKLRTLLKTKDEKEREAVAAKFTDSFAAKIREEYEVKRKMKVADMSADLMNAGEDLVLIIDSKITAGPAQRIRSATVFLHGDGVLNVSYLYNETAPKVLIEQLDAMALSVKWAK